jgi:carboxyl-terminal processing protease
MQKETRVRRIFNFSVALALVLSFVLGFQTAGLANLLSQQDKLPTWLGRAVSNLTFDVQARYDGVSQKDLRVFYETLAFITQTYLHRDQIKVPNLVEGAASGAVQSLGDRYSRFVPPPDQKALAEEIEGEYAGIGVSIVDKPMVLPPIALECEIAAGGDKESPKYFQELRGVVVVNVFEVGPAFEAGLKADDVIVCVDGKPLRNKVGDDAVSLIKGKPDTIVKINVWRPSTQKEIAFDVTRRVVQVPTVGKKEMLKDNIGYIRLDTFNNLSSGDVQNAIADLLGQGMQGLIFDLRNNTGGPLEAAVGVADQFIPGGNLVYYQDSEGKTNEFPSQDDGASLKLPLVLLVNGNTASASEIVAGAVRDTNTGLLVGENTFGKGVVQNVYNLSDGSGLVLTTGRYLTPGKHEITQDGLTPDVMSDLNPERLRAADPNIGAFLDRIDAINKEYTDLREQMLKYLDAHDFQRDAAITVMEKWMTTGVMPKPEVPASSESTAPTEIN